MGFDLCRDHLITMGYPEQIGEFEYDPSFVLRYFPFQQLNNWRLYSFLTKTLSFSPFYSRGQRLVVRHALRQSVKSRRLRQHIGLLAWIPVSQAVSCSCCHSQSIRNNLIKFQILLVRKSTPCTRTNSFNWTSRGCTCSTRSSTCPSATC